MGAVRDQLLEVVKRARVVVAQGAVALVSSTTCQGLWFDQAACESVKGQFRRMGADVDALEKRIQALNETGGAPAKAEAQKIVDRAYLLEAEANQALRGDYGDEAFLDYASAVQWFLEAIKAAAKAVTQFTFEVAKSVVRGAVDGVGSAALSDWSGLVVLFLVFKLLEHRSS